MKNQSKIIFVCLFVVAAISCQKNNSYVRSEGMIWNTLYHVTYKGPQELQDSILPVLNEVSKSLSVFDRSSLVAELNDTDRLQVDDHFIRVYDASYNINRLSKGLFDPTVSPLIDAWGFGKEHTSNKDTLKLDSILSFVGIEKTRRIDDIIIKDDIRIQFNFSAIAKGYGCDAVGAMLKRNGVNDFMVEIGGEVLMSGISPSGKDWHIAIDSPIEGSAPGQETAFILSLTDAGVATSGNYRNFRMDGDKKIAHTISPRTGKPLIGEVTSSTIIASNCMEADGIATACMAATLTEAINIITESKTEGLLILQDSVWMSDGFKKYIISEVWEPGKTDRN